MPEPVRPRGIETRLPCPVCLGLLMEKAPVVGTAGGLVLDHCARCGGVWFERGEVRALTAERPSDLWAHVAPKEGAPKPPCHKCRTPLDRDADKCGACGRANIISCPSCDELMARRKFDALTLDVCTRCHGIWFDNHELASIWKLNIASAADAARRRGSRGADALAVGGDVLMEAMFWTPGLVIDGAVGVAHLGGAAIEVVGSAAEGVFETIVHIISSLFE